MKAKKTVLFLIFSLILFGCSNVSEAASGVPPEEKSISQFSSSSSSAAQADPEPAEPAPEQVPEPGSATDIAAEAQNLVYLYITSSPKAAAISSASSGILYDKIPVYTYHDGGFEPYNDADYHPVAVEGDMIGIFTVNRDGTENSEVYTFSSEFVEELKDFSSRNSRVCIVFNGMKMYLVSPDEKKKLYDGHGYFLGEEEGEDPQVAGDSSFEEIEIGTQGLDFYNLEEPKEIAALKLQEN